MALPLAECQSIAETIASKLGVEAVDVANIDDATIASHRENDLRYFSNGVPGTSRMTGMTA